MSITQAEVLDLFSQVSAIKGGDQLLMVKANGDGTVTATKITAELLRAYLYAGDAASEWYTISIDEEGYLCLGGVRTQTRITAFSEALREETTRATAAELANTGAISTEVSRAQAAEAVIQSGVTQNGTAIVAIQDVIAQILNAIDVLNGDDVEVVDDLGDVATPDTTKIYRVPNVDDVSGEVESYTDYMCVDATTTPPAWKEISTHAMPGIDTAPTKNSRKIVEGGGIFNAIQNEAIFDISVRNAIGGVPYKYADLAAALGVGGGNVPADYRHGGMNVRFVKEIVASTFHVEVSGNAHGVAVDDVLLSETSEITAGDYVAGQLGDFPGIGSLAVGSHKVFYVQNDYPTLTYTTWTVTKLTDGVSKYEQWRLMSATWSTAVADWQGVVNEITSDSNNTPNSKAVLGLLNELMMDVPCNDANYAVLANGKFGTSSTYKHGVYKVSAGERYVVKSTQDPSDTSPWTRYAFATSNVVTSGGVIPVVAGTSVVEIPVGGSALVTIPVGCEYLLVNYGDSYPLNVKGYVLLDEKPTPESNRLVKSGGTMSLSELNVQCTELEFVKADGSVSSTSSTLFKVTDEVFAVPGITLYRVRGAGTPRCQVAFYDGNHQFVSAITTEEALVEKVNLTNENIPANAVYFRANLDKTRGKVYSKYRTDIKPYVDSINSSIANVNAFVDKGNNSLFYLEGFTTYRAGLMVLSARMYHSTPYIDINDIPNGTEIKCLISANIHIQCFDSDKQFLGVYNDFSDISDATDVTFNFDTTKLQQSTKYIRLSERNHIGYIKGLSYSGKYAEQTDNEFAVPAGDISNACYKENISHVLKNIRMLKVNADYYDYDDVYISRIPAYTEFKNANTTDYFIFDFYKNNLLSRFKLLLKNGSIDGDTIYFNTGRIVFEYDYSQLKHHYVAGGAQNLAKLTKKAFKNAFPESSGEPYVTSNAWSEIANSFIFVEYKTDKVLDVTCQRFPATNDALAEGTDESFCFYVWNGNTVVKKIFCDISDAQVENSVITYVSDLLSFTVDYTVCGTVARKSSTSRQDLSFAESAFKIIDNTDYHIRKDIANKKYANMSSSTFTSGLTPSPFASKKWHKECVEYLGMEYMDYGMGGTRYRCYSDTEFSLDYQKSDQTLYPTHNRVMLNQVAKICTDAANNGYYPDIISSCCVLNDCYNATELITRIGTAEEAFAQTMPEFDLSTAATIERDFSAFYESTDEGIAAFRSKSCNCMRLVYELLSRRFPKAQIIIWSCQQVTYNGMDQNAITHFNEEQKKIAQRLAIKYVDLNAECGINQITASTFLRDDGLHPNIDGQIVYYNYVKEKLNNIIALKKELI